MGAGEAPGVWRGSWATALGLEGVVGADELRALVNGHDPNSGTDLLAGHRERKVRAIDVTLSCPKSVSLLWAFGTPETSAVGVDRGGGGNRRRADVSGGTCRVRPSAAGRGATAGRHRRVRDRDVRASHQPCGRPAAAHPLPDPQRGAPSGRRVCRVRRQPAARLGQSRRTDVPERPRTEPERTSRGGVGPGTQRLSRDGRLHPRPTADVLETHASRSRPASKRAASWRSRRSGNGCAPTTGHRWRPANARTRR